METYDDVMAGVPPLVEETAAKFEELPSTNGNDARHHEGESPAEEFNRTVSVSDLLKKHQWKQGHESGGNVHWTRPGKTGGTSATVKDNLLYVFTSADPHFENNRGYNAFQAYARLEFGGDESAAATAILKRRSKTMYRGPRAEAQESDSEPQNETVEIRTPQDLWTFNTTDDSKCLLGRRFLCEQGSMLVVGESGIGKSSLTMQGAICWGLGLDLFGIRPTRRLKSLVIQAENDDGDLAEEMQGIIRGLQLEHRLGELGGQVAIVSESARTGTQFAAFVRRLVRIYKPDLVWIDNLLSYLGGDVCDQKTVSVFLRNQLNPIAKETGCAFVVIHHTGKPAKDQQQRRPAGNSQYAYLGIGSSDITNWARAILVLRESGDGVYELRAAKRGLRSGLFECKTGTIPGRSAFIAHGEQGIYWRWSDVVPGQDERDAQADRVQAVLIELGTASHRYTDIIQTIKKVLDRRADSTAEKFFAEHLKRHLRYMKSTGHYSVITPNPDEPRFNPDRGTTPTTPTTTSSRGVGNRGKAGK